MRAERGAASAGAIRNAQPGTPRVTVRPYYGGPPFSGLDAGRMKGGESPPDQGGRNAPRPAPEATVPGCEIAAMERRKASAPRRARHAARRDGRLDAPIGAPSPRTCRRGGDRQGRRPRRRKTPADGACLFRKVRRSHARTAPTGPNVTKSQQRETIGANRPQSPKKSAFAERFGLSLAGLRMVLFRHKKFNGVGGLG